jgi:hypothetical protein
MLQILVGLIIVFVVPVIIGAFTHISHSNVSYNIVETWATGAAIIAAVVALVLMLAFVGVALYGIGSIFVR